MDGVWISAAEAYERVSRAIHFRAAQAICCRARDGLIVATAHTLILGERRLNDAEVPAAFWWAGGEAALTQKWPSGDFETWIDNRVRCRAYGVKFRRSDIEAMLPSARVTRKAERPADGNYAPSSQCIKELQKQLGCTANEAGEHIARFSRARLIEGRCGSLWCQVTEQRGFHEQEETTVAIPEWFWEHCATGPDAILDWHSGTFAGRGIVHGQTYKVLIKGAEFDVAGVVALEAMLARREDSGVTAPIVAMSNSPQPAMPQNGGRPKSERWSAWITELVGHIHDEGIPPGSGVEGQDAIIAAVDEQLLVEGMEGLGRSTVQPIIRAVLLRLRSADK